MIFLVCVCIIKSDNFECIVFVIKWIDEIYVYEVKVLRRFEYGYLFWGIVLRLCVVWCFCVYC